MPNDTKPIVRDLVAEDQRRLEQAILVVRDAQEKRIHGVVEIHFQAGKIVYAKTAHVTKIVK